MTATNLLIVAEAPGEEPVEPVLVTTKIHLIILFSLISDYFGVVVQRSAKVFVRGCEKFVLPLAYMFCPALPGSFLARFAYIFANLCRHRLAYNL